MSAKDKLEQLQAEFGMDTNIQSLNSKRFDGVKVSIKREDQNHAIVQGNKWHKLKLNVQSYLEGSYSSILTFGGAFSNHIYATAGLCYLLDIPCIVYVRGYQLDMDNPTLNQLYKWKASIILISPKEYKEKNTEEFLQALASRHKGAYIIPEGGSNELGFKGMCSFADRVKQECKILPDYLCISSGTGASAAAFIERFKETETKVLVFSSLKGYDFERSLLEEFGVVTGNWELIHDYHFGGYAKINTELVNYINEFYKEFGVPLDPVYTGKMLFGLQDLVKRKIVAQGCSVVLIHSGGLQGIAAHNYLNGTKKGFLLSK